MTAVLAWREARWILRHPLFLTGIAGSIVLIWLSTAWEQAPVMHRDDIRLAYDIIPIAAASMIVCNLLALRARRHGIEELEDSTPTSRERRTTAQIVAFTVPVLACSFIVGGYVALLYALGGIWAPSAQELAVGPVFVALAATAGVALARWIPSPVAAPLGVLAFLAFQIRASSGIYEAYDGGFRSIWFRPLVDAGNELHVPELALRPAGWHLLYLVGLVGLLAALAALRHGWHTGRFAMGIAAVALIATGGAMQARPVNRQALLSKATLVTDPAPHQICEKLATITYCVFPAYREWVSRWNVTAKSVLRPLPTTTRPVITVRQLFDAGELQRLGFPKGEAAKAAYDWQRTEEIPLRAAWGRGDLARDASFDLAIAIARRAVGASERRVSEERIYDSADVEWARRFRPAAEVKIGERYVVEGVCAMFGEAREAIALWLAAQAVPGAESMFRSALLLDNQGTIPPGSFTRSGAFFALATSETSWSRVGVETALDLLALPQARVDRIMKENWSSLSSASVSIASLRNVFGMPAIPTASVARAQFPPTCVSV